MDYNRKIVLEDGQEYCGYGFGAQKDRVCELVFNTSMAGYQEILSDPSYAGQAVVMTYPLIGNYGINDDDFETEIPAIGALIVREYNDEPSNFRSRHTLDEIMKKYGVCGIYGPDTRKLARSIRNYGSRKALITDAGTDSRTALKLLAETELPSDSVSKVSCRQPYTVMAVPERFRVAAIDCGMKKNIVRCLADRGCSVLVFPWNTSAEEILKSRPDGLFISNGPGDPADVPETEETVRNLLGKLPVFGICLGHQIIARAYGAETYKLKFGHRGGNHPVKNLDTGRIEITSQNHSFAVKKDSLADTPLTVTHVNLLDGTIEGLKCERDGMFCVQFHPESAPGPVDSGYLFDRFIKMMEENA